MASSENTRNCVTDGANKWYKGKIPFCIKGDMKPLQKNVLPPFV